MRNESHAPARTGMHVDSPGLALCDALRRHKDRRRARAGRIAMTRLHVGSLGRARGARPDLPARPDTALVRFHAQAPAWEEQFSTHRVTHSILNEGLTRMNPDEYRARARRCRVAAAQSDEPLRRDFLDAAEAWDQLADQLQWLEKFAGHTPSQTDANNPAGPDLP